ncbi:MAG: hypothetical protein JW910_15205 [Anaerolineae bacterium]|nr:hypothetical protein [Anaerolineae bacterium]
MTITEILDAIEQLDPVEQDQLWAQLRERFAALLSLPEAQDRPGIYDVQFDDLPLPEDWPPADYALNLDHYLYGTPKRDV